MQHVPLSGHCSWNPNYFGTMDHGLLEAMLREKISAEVHIYNMTSIPKDFAHEWQGLCTRTARTLRTNGADKKVFRRGSSAGSDCASWRIVARFRARWWSATPLFPVRS